MNMKKRILFFLLVFSLPGCSFNFDSLASEVLIPIIDTSHKGLGMALWMSYYHAEMEDGIPVDTRIDYQIVGERTVNGENYSILSASDRFGETISKSLLYRQEGNKVYLLCDDFGEKRLILDFDLEVGNEFTAFDGERFIVREKGFFSEYDSLLYRYGDMAKTRPLMLRLTDKDGNEDVWIEGIGSVYWCIVPNSIVSQKAFLGKRCRIISSSVTLVKSVFPYQYGAFFNTNLPQYKFKVFEPESFDNVDEMMYYFDRYLMGNRFQTLSFEGDTLCIRCTEKLNCYTTFVECYIDDNNETELHIGQHVFKGYEKDCLDFKWVNVRIPGFQPGTYHFTSWSGTEFDKYPLDITLECKGTVGIQRNKDCEEGLRAYDLQGRRLQKVPEKGLYIQDGKKKAAK